MDKPNLMESVQPHSGQYSLLTDFRLNAWLGVATAAYLADLFLLKRHPEWSPLLRALLALAPLLPGMLYLRSCLRFIWGLDELQRRIQLDAVLFASLGTVIGNMAVNILNEHAVHLPGLDCGLGLIGTFMMMFTLWLVGGALANARFK